MMFDEDAKELLSVMAYAARAPNVHEPLGHELCSRRKACLEELYLDVLREFVTSLNRSVHLPFAKLSTRTKGHLCESQVQCGDPGIARD